MSNSTTKKMAGKTALITGAGRGIGRATALLMAEHGANIVVNDLGGSADGVGADQGPAQDVVREITEKGGKAIASAHSVTDFSAAEEMVDLAIKNFGSLDVVVNNAGILRDVIFHKMTEADWDSVVNVHLKGSFNVSRAAAGHFRKQGSGAFVHMTSTSGLIGNYGQANYAAAKLGIVGLSKMIALDMERFNVRSNCIAPFAWSRLIGTIPTETPDQKARVERMMRMTPEKIAPLVVSLACPEADGVSGQVFAIRGNEVFLMSQSRPIRGMHCDGGWSVEDLLDRGLTGLRDSMYPLHVSSNVFSWEPL